ncbi:MAG: YkgJ family cysteine cluster protein [Methanothrix sp.]|nr:YkgJ family cysteine cluster protein [Methanothrix sp.]
MAEMIRDMRDPCIVASELLKAISIPDDQVFTGLDEIRYTTADYYRMACHLLFACKRCGHCCTSGDPIRLRAEDARAIARHLKIPLNKFLKKFTIPDPNKPDVLDFKHILPCKFYDSRVGGCKIYGVRPWSCRIFPFLGIYGSEDRVVVNESCPGSVETMNILKKALEEAQPGSKGAFSASIQEVREAKAFLRLALESL